MGYLKTLKQRLKSKRFDWRRVPEFWHTRTKALKKIYCEGYNEGWKDCVSEGVVPVCFEDNNGADLIEMIPNEDGTYTMNVGYQSEYVFRETGTITELVEMLKDMYEKAENYNLCAFD